VNKTYLGGSLKQKMFLFGDLIAIEGIVLVSER
jgi:hypothetical protein